MTMLAVATHGRDTSNRRLVKLLINHAIFAYRRMGQDIFYYSSARLQEPFFGTDVNLMADNSSIKKYKLLFTAKGKKFDVTNTSRYHLSIHVSDAYLKVSCVDAATTQCLFLETYVLMYRHAAQRVHAIKELYQDHALLAGSWSTVTLCIDNQQYTLVPRELVQVGKLADYLNFACLVHGARIRHFTHSSLHMTMIFAMDPWLSNWLHETYPHTQLCTVHQASSLIEGMWTYLKEQKPRPSPKVLVFVASSCLHIGIMQKSGLLYYNRFEYASGDKMLYYILVAMRTLEIDTTSHEVTLGGNITKDSPLHKKVLRYLPKLTFIRSLPYLQCKSILSEEMMRTHLDVLSAHLCHLAPQKN